MDYTQAIEVAPQIYWVGSYLENDPFQCHPYLIINGDESILVDPGSMLEFESLIAKTRTITELSNIKYIILHHQDPDLCASVPEIEKLINRDDLLIVTHSRMTVLIKHYLTTSDYYEIDKQNLELVTKNGLTLKFVTTPYCHSPGAFVSYEPKSKTLFSSDIFGGLEESWEFYANENYFDHAKAFHASYMPGKDIFNYTLRKIEQLDINLIAPQHGSIIKNKYIPKLIDDMKNLNCGLYIDCTYNEELLDVINQLKKSQDALQRNEQTLKQKEQFLQSVVDGSADPIMVVNCDHTVALMNDAAKNAINYDFIADKDSPKCYEISHYSNKPCESENEPCPLGMIIKNKQAIQVTHIHSLENNEKQYVELSAKPLLDDKGDVYAIIETAHDITRHQENHEQLSQQKKILDYKANHDDLTGLPTRELLFDRLQQSIKQAIRQKNKVVVLFIDLDNFKPINDTMGHQAGDLVLQTIALRFKKILRQVDTVARIGGDEFIIVLNSLEQQQDIIEVVDKLIASSKETINIDGKAISIKLSIGISIYPDDSVDTKTLVKYADSAMYEAKALGGDTYRFYSQ
ncbi:MAG: diguanylate cyclase [Gammaproteobacteria bacterium]|nr:diguanylate cyclase [Gammaproteobacteria bacterium]